ncbi:hypothetical protein J1N35_014492 [Gossypium stocksii]|uniref:Retrovirus-related Pol polyprotein from transposon TNT 1-94-like beta-barrel domain-containing protein n=1 Tax=Gossypium stocksii TaxID=47602 RepID=A0A9D3VW64_9ROSI|nr:hypothetical protein J1N35_014492 [Gossypium stocksii]
MMLSDQLSDRRIIEKVITTLPKKYESRISSLEDSRDVITISLLELINALYARDGYTNHMVSDESMFKEIDRSFSSRIRVRNGHIIEAKGKGDVQVSTPVGAKVIIDVLFIPNIDQNLLSVGQLVEKNYSVIF